MPTADPRSTFPNPCARCGFCCIQRPCDPALYFAAFSGLPAHPHKPCPFLGFLKSPHDSLEAHCILVKILQLPTPVSALVFGFGKGCCVKATLFKGSTPHDFSIFPPESKRAIVRLHYKEFIDSLRKP